MKPLSTVEFLSYLAGLDVKVSAEGNRFLINAPAGVVTPEIRQELAARKSEILQFLKEASQATLLVPPPIQPAPGDGELPLSFSQLRLWLLDRLEPGTPAYNIQSPFLLRGDLNVAVLRQTVTEIVRRHEALRTYFAIVEGQPVQKIAPPEPLPIAVVDLSGLTEEEWQKEAARLALVDAQQSFDLQKSPLIRATLLKRSAKEHLLLFNFHHIVFDEWSLGVFQKELSALYEAYASGRPSPLGELPLQYADYAVWQRNWLQGKALETQLEYWKKQLKGPLPVLELPTDRPRPSVQTHSGSTVSLMLSPKLRDELNALSRREGVTLFVTLLAAFEILLLRYTGQEDLLVGTPIANRNRTELEGLIGFFVNTLAMRNDLSGNPSFLELLRRVQETALGAYAHQDLPFEMLVQELNPERDLSRSPILQILFSFLNTPTEPVKFPGLEVIRVTGEAGASKVDLSLYAIELAEGILCTFEYNTDLFDGDRIQRLAKHLEALLEDIVREPAKRLSELAILTAAEQRQLLVEWNAAQADYPRGLTLHELFERQAQRTSEAVAVEFEGRKLSYRELNERANQLARHLQSLGVGPDVLVGLFHERSEDMMVALVGILKAGGAYVPLDPSFPEERLRYMVEDSGMRVLVTQSSLDGLLPWRPASVVRLDSDWKEIAKQSAEPLPSPNACAKNLAYVLYTSGSTGNPKGVEIEHAAIVNLLLSMQREPGFTASDTLLAVTTLSFDIAGLELYLPLISGGRVVLASREDAHDPARLMQLMNASCCTVMQATPATWRALIHAGWSGSPKLKALCGGEGFSSDFAETLRSRCGELWNMYGPTETTVWSTICRLLPADRTVSIGRPIANTSVFVLDAHRNPAPVGVNGELYIGGAGVARGYRNRSDLTKERFVDSPFEPNARLYRTGDLARWLPDGRLECLGRVDNQVKIRGFRIELEEIEEILNRHPAVRHCAVIAAEDSSGDKKLAAYCETRGDAQPNVAELRDHLKNQLPDYMIPTAWAVLAALPLTPNNKVDRQALLRLEPQQSAQISTSHVPPRTETEKILAKIWQEVLETKEVGIHDNFFELGGHSLRAVNLIGEAERKFGMRFPLISLFHSPTIAQFAEVVEREQSRSKSRNRLELEHISQQVRHFVVENYLNGHDNGLQDSDSFVEHDVIDPLRLHELVEFLVETYGIAMDGELLTGANLDSIQHVSRFVCEQLSGHANSDRRGVADDRVEVNP